MASLSLAYRPRSFSEVIGNKSTIASLESILKRNREDIPHAILFTGASGCLRGDTMIFDPITKTNTSIKDRWKSAFDKFGISGKQISLKTDTVNQSLNVIENVTSKRRLLATK